MAEAFDLVRTVRQHLRRSAILLDEGRHDEALAQVDAALVLDPQSLPAQAMRDRVTAAQAGAPPPVRSATEPAARSFVPHGVNAASWRGFEQRITERRFKALLETINTSIVAGDAAAARAALEEARALRPDAHGLSEFEARVAAVPMAVPAAATKTSPRVWMRAMGAAALFLLGVSLLLGLEWIRPGERVPVAAPIPAAAPDVPASAPVKDARPETSPDLGPVPIALNDDDDSVPAIVTPPEPLLQPTGTAGAPTSETEAAPRSMIARSVAPPILDRMPERRTIETAPPEPPPTEPDPLPAPERVAIAANTAPAAAPPVTTSDTPVSADVRGAMSAPAASVASAISVPSTLDQQIRVEEVLRRYARAYGQLDASAARAVWPTVDERALAQAFRNLASQRVSFEDCNIDIRGAIANASCRGQTTYAPKVGNREPRTEPRDWQFELRRDGDAWQIVEVEARRAR